MALLWLGGCARPGGLPTASPTGNEAPVSLRSVQIEDIQGHRAILLHLTRVPTMVRYSKSSSPAEIVVEAWGPPGDGDLAERVMPQSDSLVTEVRVSRHNGGLKVVVALVGVEAPPHTVHEMADWIMIRIGSEGAG